MYRVYDIQLNEWRGETHKNKDELAEEFRGFWSEINFDSEYNDVKQSELDETATFEEVEKIIKKRVYKKTAEEYLRDCGFEIRKYEGINIERARVRLWG